MGAVKMMREKMADEGLQSYIVTFADADGVKDTKQFWAEDYGHAGEQADDELDMDFEYHIALVETQDEYEARTGTILDYGRTENL